MEMSQICRLFMLAMFLCTVCSSTVPYKEYFFDQTLDHFNFYSAAYGKSTFKQRLLLQGPNMAHCVIVHIISPMECIPDNFSNAFEFYK